MGIGQNIKRYRIEKKLTQKELAEKSNLAEITIRQYENNKREPRLAQIRSIANALGVSLGDLMVIKEDKEINVPEPQIGDKRKHAQDLVYSMNEAGLDEYIRVGEIIIGNPKYTQQ